MTPCERDGRHLQNCLQLSQCHGGLMVCGCSINVWCTMLTLEDLLVVCVRVSVCFLCVCLCVSVCFWVFVKRKSQEQFLSKNFVSRNAPKKLFVSKKFCVSPTNFLCPRKLCDLRIQSCSTKGHYSAVFESNDCPGADAPEQLTSWVSVDVTKNSPSLLETV